MAIVFRRVNYDDIEGVIELCNECFDEVSNLDYARRVFEETLDDKNQIYIVGFLDGIMVAHAKITIIPTIYEEMNTYAILNHICVKPEYRRHKIATKMLEEIERICREEHCVEMKLWSKNFRHAAHELYKCYGFEVIEAKFFSKEVK